MDTSFARQVNRTLRIAEGSKLLFSRVELGLDTRKLFFKERQSLLGFGTAHFDILLQVRIRNRIQNGSDAVGIAVFKRDPDNTGILTFFRNAESLKQACSSSLRMNSTQQERLTNSRGQGLDANDQGITSKGLTVGFTDSTSKDDLAL